VRTARRPLPSRHALGWRVSRRVAGFAPGGRRHRRLALRGPLDRRL